MLDQVTHDNIKPNLLIWEYVSKMTVAWHVQSHPWFGHMNMHNAKINRKNLELCSYIISQKRRKSMIYVRYSFVKTS